jgi:nucleotide-binding universal stress UspA family protein
MMEPSIRRVLCAVDVTRPALGALRRGLQIAERFRATCDAVYARDPLPQLRLATLLPSMDELVSRLDAEERLGTLLRAEGGETASRYSIDGMPSATILARSAVTNADLIVLGWKPSGEQDPAKSSVAHLIASRATCAVLTVSGEPHADTIRRIAVPVDFSTATRPALSWAATFARHFRAQVHLVHVFKPRALRPDTVSAAQAAFKLRAAVASLQEAGICASGEVLDSVAGASHAILDHCRDQDFEFMIMGAHRDVADDDEGQGVVARVRRDAGLPVLSVRPPGPPVRFASLGKSARGIRYAGAA